MLLGPNIIVHNHLLLFTGSKTKCLVLNCYAISITDNITDCWAHLINRGVLVSGRSATVEWQATGPTADNRVQNFQCSLNGGTRRSCKLTL